MTQEMSLLTLMNTGWRSVEINLITCQMCPESLSMKETHLTWEHRNLCAILAEGSKSRSACSEFTVVRNPWVSLRSDCRDSQSLLLLGYRWNFHSILRKLSANSPWKAQWNKYCLCVTLVEGNSYPKEKDIWKLIRKGTLGPSGLESDQRLGKRNGKKEWVLKSMRPRIKGTVGSGEENWFRIWVIQRDQDFPRR